MTWRVIILTLSIALLWTSPSHGNTQITTCVVKSACSCESEKGLINLKPLAHDGKPAFMALQNDDGKTETYYYNPCVDFKIGNIPKGSAAVQKTHNNVYFMIGFNEKMKSNVEEGILTFTLPGDQGRKTRIAVICTNSTTKFSFVHENPTNTYNFRLESSYGCPMTSSGSEGMSMGTIMLIAFLVIVVVYLVAGVLFNVFIRKTQGKERIPNVGFWIVLPSLIKDGFRFVYTRGSRSTTYSSI